MEIKDKIIKNGFSVPSHPLTNFETRKYYQNKPRFSGVYSRYNLKKNKGWGIYNKS